MTILLLYKLTDELTTCTVTMVNRSIDNHLVFYITNYKITAGHDAASMKPDKSHKVLLQAASNNINTN